MVTSGAHFWTRRWISSTDMVRKVSPCERQPVRPASHPGATYHHFEDKDALIAAVAEEGFDLLHRELQTAAQRPAASARNRARNVGVAYVLFAIKHPTRFRVMVGYGVQAGTRIKSARAAYRLVREVLVESLGRSTGKTCPNRRFSVGGASCMALHFLPSMAISVSSVRRRIRAENLVHQVIVALDPRAAPTG